MSGFATYLHKEMLQANKPLDQIGFTGYSVPHFRRVRDGIVAKAGHHRQLPLAKADFQDYYRIHDAQYLDGLQLLAAGKQPDPMPMLSMECNGYEYFLGAYCYGLGGLYAAIDAMKAGTLQHAYTFPLGGHHAFTNRGHGYCLLNPMAVAARYAQQHGFNNILMIDWDIHHGDGTQQIFEHDATVYHISIHDVTDLYITMKRGLRQMTAEYAQSVGQCNVPIASSYFDDDFMKKMGIETYFRTDKCMTAFQDALTTIPFEPDIIFVFSGVDSHVLDCGELTTAWTNDDFVTLTRLVLNMAEKFHAPLLFAHGGGYKENVTVDAAVTIIETLAAN